MYQRILSDDEIAALYGQPRFAPEEQAEYFALSAEEKATQELLHSVKSQTFFILQLGYFKARRLFFAWGMDEVREDIHFIQACYFPDYPPITSVIAKATRIKHQQLILALFNYRYCHTEERQTLSLKAKQVAKVSSRPIYICRELIHHLQQQCIVLPGYRFLQEMVSQVLIDEQNRLTQIVREHLGEADILALKQLLADTQGLYEITQLKQEPRNFREGEIKRELQRGQQLEPIYRLAQGLLPRMGISRESVKYYASLVGYYSVYKLNRMDVWQVYVYLLCFALHRTQRLHDNLINSLLYHVRHFREEAKVAARDKLLEGYQKANQDMEKAGEVLKLFTADSIAAETPFHEVQETAFAILGREKLLEVANRIAATPGLDEQVFQWEHIDSLAIRFKRQLRPVIQAISFASPQQDDPLVEAISFLKTAFQHGRALGTYAPDTLPTQVIPKPVGRYLYRQDGNDGNKQLITNRYEFWVYRLMRNALEAGDLFCRDSVRFRSFEDDLVDDQQWQHKHRLMDEAGLAILNQPAAEHLAELEQQLEARITAVNQRIASGGNGHLQFRQLGKQRQWTLKYPSPTETVNHPFFDGLKPTNIASVLDYVNRHCPFMDAFEHVLGRFTRQALDGQALVAALLAWGTNLGLGRMGEISDMDYQRLASTSDNRIRLETLREANDRISNGIAKLPIFQHYTLGSGIHSSSDGQKFETSRDTLNARHSPKYFGLKKGIVSYTLVANHVPVNAEVIGANEHESHYVFDLLHNNTTDIEIGTHSTDTHGANQVNFAILYPFGYQFAPRYRDIYSVVTTSLYGFKPPSHYEECVIKPAHKVNTGLIISEWDNIQRIMVSLAQKTTTQSIIIGKLSAYARKNRTKRALWEYDSIIRSLYLLDYVDSLPLRQNVQKALNRGESYHKLRRAIAYANFGKLRFKTEHEQQIWNECSRLLTNCIIHYNASLLSGVLALREQAGDHEGIAKLARVSPVAWSHINLFGRYEFGKPLEPIDLDRLIGELARMPVPHDSGGEVLE